jgi:hypothetical protein
MILFKLLFKVANILLIISFNSFSDGLFELPVIEVSKLPLLISLATKIVLEIKSLSNEKFVFVFPILILINFISFF